MINGNVKLLMQSVPAPEHAPALSLQQGALFTQMKTVKTLERKLKLMA